jgi:hypothetical protein
MLAASLVYHIIVIFRVKPGEIRRFLANMGEKGELRVIYRENMGEWSK